MEAYRYLAKVYNSLMTDANYDEWALYLNSLLNGKELRIFEAACGTGSITGRLYDMGHDLVAADISGEMLDIAVRDSREHGREIVFIRQDMRHIIATKKFDAVVSACDGPNYLNRDGIADFFSAAYHILKPKGRLLFDISSTYKLRSMDGEVYYDDGEDETCIWSNHFDAPKNKLIMDVTLFIRHGNLYKKLSEQHIQYAHDVEGVKKSLYNAGFGQIEVYEAFTKDEVKSDSNRIQFVCHKD